MDRLDIGYTGIAALLILLAVRVPIGVALGLISFFGIWAITTSQAAWGLFTALPFNFIGDWSLSAVPMFLFMGYIAGQTGLTSSAFRAMRVFLAGFPGGLACASVGACALFAAASGSSVATAAAMARTAVPEMLRARYDPGLATGTVAAAGTLGSLIPPSVLMVIYGIFAEVSIGRLFLAGFLPGMLTAAVYILMITTRVRLKPSLAPEIATRVTAGDRLQALIEIWPFPVLIAGVLGGIFAGVFTPTEAGAAGAFLALVIAAVQRQFTWQAFKRACFETAESTAAIFIIVVGSVLFTRFMALSGVPDGLAEWMLAGGSDPWLIILQIALLYLVLGMFIDPFGIMLLTLPIILPVLEAAQVDLIYFGIILIKLLEISLITPPVGFNVYVIKTAVGDTISITTIFKGVTWFIVAELFVLALLILFPVISLFLPGLAR